jgi:regulator of nucleoside diphosphate kinase
MTNSTRLPHITLTVADRDRLELLANASMTRFPQTADYLAREVERARIIGPGIGPGDDGPNFIRMGSRVDFRDDETGRVRSVTLVYPDQADVTAGCISVMTPVGAALIGLSKGQSIEWQTPAGAWRTLSVLSVSNAPQEKTVSEPGAAQKSAKKQTPFEGANLRAAHAADVP